MPELFPFKNTGDALSNGVKPFAAFGNAKQPGVNEYHAALLLYDGKRWLKCDYDTSVQVDSLNDTYAYRPTKTIHPDEVPALIAFCKRVCKRSNPKYGYFYDGGLYDNVTGAWSGDSDTGERMTCVGFCLSLYKGFTSNDYLVYSDWSNDEASLRWTKRFCTRRGIAYTKVQDKVKRIHPDDLLYATIDDSPAIAKVTVDRIKDEHNFQG